MYETNSWQFPQAVSKTYPPSAICPYLPLDPRHRPCWPLASPGQRRMGEKMRKVIQKAAKYDVHMGMDQYLLIPFLGEWTSIYQLFWCSPGVQGFDTLPYHDFVGIIDILWGSWRQLGIEPLYKRMISIRKLRRIWPFQGREGLRGTNVTWWCQSDSPSSLTTNRPMSKTIFKNARSPKDHQRSIVWC